MPDAVQDMVLQAVTNKLQAVTNKLQAMNNKLQAMTNKLQAMTIKLQAVVLQAVTKTTLPSQNDVHPIANLTFNNGWEQILHCRLWMGAVAADG